MFFVWIFSGLVFVVLYVYYPTSTYYNLFFSIQVLEERIHHIEYVPNIPEPYYQPTGRELQPRPVGEENGVIVYSYNPISAVNYVSIFSLCLLHFYSFGIVLFCLYILQSNSNIVHLLYLISELSPHHQSKQISLVHFLWPNHCCVLYSSINWSNFCF